MSSTCTTLYSLVLTWHQYSRRSFTVDALLLSAGSVNLNRGVAPAPPGVLGELSGNDKIEFREKEINF